MFIASQKQGSYVTSLSQWFVSIGAFFSSYIVAIPLTLLCEVPFMNIEKLVLFPQKKKIVKAHSEITQEIQGPLLEKKIDGNNLDSSKNQYFQLSNEETEDLRDDTFKMKK